MKTCCGRPSTPEAILCAANDNTAQLNQIINCSQWNDRCCSTAQRRVKWYILRDNQPLYIFDWASPDTPIPIGQGSTYSLWHFSEGGQEVFSFLENLGFTFSAGEEIKIRIRIQNCQCRLSPTWSNAVILTYSECECPYPWLTLNGESWQTMQEECWQVFPTLDDPVIVKPAP